MVNYEIVEVAKTLQGFKFEIKVAGFDTPFWMIMPGVMYNQMTADQIKNHIQVVVDARYGSTLITSEEDLKLSAIMAK